MTREKEPWLQHALRSWADFAAPLIAVQMGCDPEKLRYLLQDHADRFGQYLDRDDGAKEWQRRRVQISAAVARRNQQNAARRARRQAQALLQDKDGSEAP